MGVTGAGKSTFINHLADDKVNVGHNMRSHTGRVDLYPATLPNGNRILLLDTPGFDDTFNKDIDILRNIATWLTDTYSHKIKLAGVIYLHRISDNRMQGSAMKNLRMFRRLVGQDGLRNVLLVTTMWENVSLAKGADREAELRENPEFWQPMVEAGSKILRHMDNRASTYNIVMELVQRQTRVTLDIQRDMVDNGMTLGQTAAGEEVHREIIALKAAWAEERKKLEEEQRQAIAERDRESHDEIVKAKAELDKKMEEARLHYEQSLEAKTADLSAQLQAQSSDWKLLQYLKREQDKKENRIWRKYNPFHLSYEEKVNQGA